MNEQQFPTLPLNDGHDMPQFGLGTHQLRGDDAVRVVRAAVEAGYRHFDTASAYGNEEEVGRALRDAIAAGDVTREELFVVSKLGNDEQGAEKVAPAFRRSLARLGLDYLDMYLLHWPWPQKGLYVESFEAMAKLQGYGDVQTVGVCNFYPELLDELIRATGVVPAVNQVEMHVGFSQSPLRRYHEEKGIISQAWSPLGQGRILSDPDVKAIGAKHDLTSAHVVLAYLLQLGVSVIPKTSSISRLNDNLRALEVKLSRSDMEVLGSLDRGDGSGRISADPRDYPGNVTEN